MDTKDLLRHQLETSAKQVDKVLEGLPEDKWDGKLREGCMSPTEIVGHLTECYIAATEHLDGKQHEWGSYVPAEDTTADLLTKMREERQKAADALVASGSEDAFKSATDYVILHDAYHVGQLATYRMGVDPEWDAYSLYS